MALQPLKPEYGRGQFTFQTNVLVSAWKKGDNVPCEISQEVPNGEYIYCSMCFISGEFLSSL